jgi:hypothetical protein
MRSFQTLALLFAQTLALLLGNAAHAQTQGVNGVNNYWITPGGLPGGFSCKPLTFNTAGFMTMRVSGAPNTPFYCTWWTCPCVACMTTPPQGSSSCLPPPTAACPSSNQFLEVGVINPCGLLTMFGGLTDAAGQATITIFVPFTANPFILSTQTIFLGAPGCVVAPWSLLFSQAWNVTFV